MNLPRIIGHRGIAGLAPENTLASFRAAAAHGLSMVEFDIRLSADGVPLVFHDDDLGRTSDGVGPVAEKTWEQLRGLDAGSWFGPDFAGEAIPSLTQVLIQCLELELAVNMEIKPDSGREAETAEAALRLALSLWPEGAPAPLVSSFERVCLDRARAVAPHWPRGLLAEELPGDWRVAARDLGCAAIHLEQSRLAPQAVAEIKGAGLAVLAYTVNDPIRQSELFAWGVAAAFSDFPGSS